MTVKEIKIGWKKLQDDLAILRTAINHNQPLRGDGILIDETDTGCVISVAPAADTGNQTDNTGTGTPVSPMTNGKWTDVTIIDPDTCAQSTLTVWALPQ